MERNLEDKDEILGGQFKSEVRENRKILRSIIDTIIFQEKQDQALRGHRDDSQYHPDVAKYSTGRAGSFIELLNYRAGGGIKT